ncbi:hypothetical protein GCM10010169_49060 [Micromonospora fulviviridis]|nr:hypothetical protein [Micromonospora fulviviridis]GGR98658.1 hypothetical protein GCM10010169_49060 [Micromonospora fulviviridis]
MTTSRPLAGQVALITGSGSGSGIGFACARRLGLLGARAYSRALRGARE